jgi:hypothetical protein
MAICQRYGYLSKTVCSTKGSALSEHLKKLKYFHLTSFKYYYDPHEFAVENLQKRIYIFEESLIKPLKTGEIS